MRKSGKAPKGLEFVLPRRALAENSQPLAATPPLARSCAAIERVLPGRPLAVNSQPLAATSPLAKSCPAVAVALRLRSRKSETTSNVEQSRPQQCAACFAGRRPLASMHSHTSVEGCLAQCSRIVSPAVYFVLFMHSFIHPFIHPVIIKLSSHAIVSAAFPLTHRF